MRVQLRLLFIVILAIGVAVSAHAQATRTWVSGVGDDANPCSRTAPCKTFAGAISKTAAGGEISVLDPGGFGAVSITKSITLNGYGTIGSILAASTNGVVINAASTDRVFLKNIMINGVGSALTGVKVLSAGSVTIEDCTIENIGSLTTHNAIHIATTSGTPTININNTTIKNTKGSGIFVAPTAGEARLSINNTRVYDSQSGMDLVQNAKAVVANSVFTGHSTSGVFVERTTTEAAFYDSILSRNGNGLNVALNGGGTARLYGCEITQNTVNGIVIGAGGTVSTHSNNAIIGNAGTQATNNTAGQQ